MEELKKKSGVEMSDKEIVFSKSIKAGKRIYYLDVKKNRKDEMFLAITESKKVISGDGDDAQISFEKHKIFLYKEDFEKFLTGLNQAVDFIVENQGPIVAKREENRSTEIPQDKVSKEDVDMTSADEPAEVTEEIKIDIDFE